MDKIVYCTLKNVETGKEYTLEQVRFLIGRAPECEIAFPEKKTISRMHAVMLYRDGRWYLTDINSVNGTWLNRERLRPDEDYPLNPGDEIDLAHVCTLVFQGGGVRSQQEPEEEVWYCTVCGSRAQGQFCVNCGSCRGAVPVRSVRPEPMPAARPREPEGKEICYCAVCGSRVYGMFCTKCGNRRDSVPAWSGQAAPMPAQQASFEAPPAPVCPSMPAAAPQQMSASQRKSASPKAKPSVEKKSGFLGGLFAGRGAKKETAPQTDDIQFRAAAPASLTPGEYFSVKVMMYLESDYERAEREERTIADRVKAATSSVFQARRQEQFRISLQSPDIPIDAESAQITWNGKYAAADFEVFLPEDYDRKQLRLTGRVYSGIAVLTDLKLILQISAPQRQELQFEKCHLRTAFISYASPDRAKVVARIQGIQASRPDMDLFFDAESLRQGEHWEERLYREIRERDLFYLFWSRNAARSEWVAKELAYALEMKGPTSVEPVPLESSDICPPPESLQDRHFNDWTLRYLTE